ncbi:hypothetical protein HOY82DRAFT_613864 [Tuber indicum]|nr:hypothetical protein HOY82DRAFT_613864 [Tuber indicum]
MELHLPPSGIPCPFLRLGQCPKSDGCEYAHDFIAQPCLSAAQIEDRMRGLEDARPASRGERAKIKRRKKQLRRLGARKLAAPSLIERGIMPTKKAINHELGRYTVGPPKNIAPTAVRERAFGGGGGGDGEWQIVEAGRERRRRKLLARMKHNNIRVRGLSGRSGANGNPSAKADFGASGVDEQVGIPRRVEIIGDFTVKYPTSIPPHLRHRYLNPPPASADSPPSQKRPPYTDEGISYFPSVETGHETGKGHVTKRDRARSL